MAKAGGFERLADERDVVRGAAAAAGLRNEHGQLVGVVAPRGDGFHNLARDQDGRVANVVVHVLQARVHRAVVDARQQIDVVAEALENGHEQLEVVRRHLRSQNRVARFLHLFGELHALELGRGGLALLEALASLGRGLFREGRRRLDGLGHGFDRRGVGGTGLLLAGAGGFGGGDARFGLGQKLFHVEAARGAFLRGGFGVGLFIGLVLQRGEQAAHANAGGAQVGDLVDLEHGVNFTGAFQNLLHLVGGERVQAAAEAVQLNEVEVAALGGNLRGGVEARVVHPLVNQANGALERAQVRDGVFREHGQTEARKQLGNRVIDFGIVVVRAAGQHNAVRAGFLHPQQGFGALFANVALEGFVFGPCGVDRGVNFGLRRRGNAFAHELRVRLHQLNHQAFLQVVFLVVGQPRVQELHVALAKLVDVQAKRLGVACHDGAIEVVARGRVFLALPLAAGEPDEVGVLLEQVHDVAVRELRRVAHTF